MQRPLSPHIQIYKLQVTSVMSILHRVSGVASIAGLILVSLPFIAAPYGQSAFEAMAALLLSWPGRIILSLFLLALCYHLCNGVRHLFWDAGRGLTMESIRRSALVVLVAALAIAAVVIIL